MDISPEDIESNDPRLFDCVASLAVSTFALNLDGQQMDVDITHALNDLTLSYEISLKL